LRFLKKFWGITPWMLELIIMLSWYLEKYLNVYIVTALLVFNAVLWFCPGGKGKRCGGVAEEEAADKLKGLAGWKVAGGTGKGCWCRGTS